MSNVNAFAKPVRDADRTKATILRAAQLAFSKRGYAAVGVREVTALAGVNPSLVNRYFGSKEKLFEAALADLLEVTLLTNQPRDSFGRSLVASFVDAPTDRINPLQILMLATSDDVARAIADRLLRAAVLVPLAQWFGRVDGEHRAARVLALAGGFFTYRLLYPLSTWTGAIEPGSRMWLEQAFQSAVDMP